ncbi:MAG: bifunctional folylpolyglutamate synthase/dihydrofolate synthase [Acidobacteriota bacterium]|nr:bifunctional folylpolyglutamate synthase/dihydrofolate synthase [Acidobacteriota bacterium]
MNFEASLQYLLSLGHEMLAIKLGLRNTELLLESLGNPHESYESVQIAGTNGKGSTAVFLDSICRAAGIRTGLYTSPHLVSITERIVIDGQDISEEDFARYASRVREAAERLVGQGKLAALPTFFEHVTAIALLAFKDAGVKLAVLETGLGGRLDATTVAAARTVAVTPITLDHQAYLGETITEIAQEKAAIIRPGVNAVIAPQDAEALRVIFQQCAACNVEPRVNDCRTTIIDTTSDGRFRVTFETSEGRDENVLLGLRGHHQVVNASVAIQLAESLRSRRFEVSDEAITEGIQRANHPGRLELHEGFPSLLLDGAHNPAGAQALREFLDEFVSVPLTLVFGVMNDKKVDELASVLFSRADRLILTRPDNVRAADVAELQPLASTMARDRAFLVTRSAAEALQKAKEITPANGLICVTGSLYLVGEVKALTNAALAGAA